SRGGPKARSKLPGFVNWLYLDTKMPTGLANNIAKPTIPILSAETLTLANFETSLSSEYLLTRTPRKISARDAKIVKAAIK
ncbi:hypothetical protein, partial [Microbulbifer mangrovi]|uniref:hypothetical protein n=1 Tax=Microbulbifer mangrovi TaxID=927787 RepID=UPI0019572F67